MLRARELMRAVQRPANREARALIAQAIKLSPGTRRSACGAWLTPSCSVRCSAGWKTCPDGLRRAEQAARRALAIDDPGANARAHAILGNIHTFTGNYAAALVDAERAIELNPSDAIARCCAAASCSGLEDRGVDRGERDGAALRPPPAGRGDVQSRARLTSPAATAKQRRPPSRWS